ncbi:bifunctional DNA-binding transcriptional regulator/O6-methylguanine-DNA methyltransferase Ada [Anatilimnocola floriformis]|uniref:bifunctional DNA-binding transcriptional regulator/O6-methylguanine-DNA methyltransferase Ada n=1 Tax=Anatilimnocola floriformis TaxID=2948575 RepID=UPI0020C3E779|nr:bifunctional DNA-binding transcriptional regulator/O6-methylguanine-DNA methyltransferase Ada [Anatilimnocola floriformis]
MSRKQKTSHTTPVARYTNDESRWQAIVDRDANADGAFVFSVRTTGIYCRPNCAARRALRKNVAFHANWEAAERAGFRACKRCKPKGAALAENHSAAVAQACRLIEQSVELPSLEQLATAIGWSVFHFHRVFKQHTGLTPKAYAVANRSRRVREELMQNQNVTTAVYNAGFNSSSRFYESADAALGMTPTNFQRGGRGLAIKFAIGECNLGSILVAATDKGICAILLGDDAELLLRELEECFPNAELTGGDGKFDKLVAEVIGLVENPALGSELPLDIRGTAFQQRVWQALQQIPPGETVRYADIARQIGSPQSFRAVAQACGANKLAVAIPCHRVVRTDGNLSGYRWGIERKEQLLQREKA